MRELSAFQQTFGRALLGGETLPDLDVALTVHRNTSIKGLVDALAANFPTVAQLVGDEWFKACAVEYVRAQPARSPVLAVYGATFPAFLAEFPPAADLPYLPEVARIDRLWVESHTAADAAVLTSTELARLPQSALISFTPTLHPAARFAWVQHSAATIWLHHRSPDSGTPLEIEDAAEGILLTRPAGRVDYQRLDRAACEFLRRLSEGSGLGPAAEATLVCAVDLDVATLLARMLVAGTFECPPEMLP